MGCPKTNNPNWDKLVKQVGLDLAKKTWVAYKDNFPPTQMSNSALKAAMGVPYKASESNKLNVFRLIRNYNKRNKTSHFVVPEQVGESLTYKFRLVPNYLPVNRKNQELRDAIRREFGKNPPAWVGNMFPDEVILQEPLAPPITDRDRREAKLREMREQKRDNLINQVFYQNNTNQSDEEYIASEKTIRDLAARMADRIGLKVKYESDRTKDYKGKLEGDTAVINLAYATLDTPIHEILGHPIIRALKTGTAQNKQLYQNLLKELEYGKGKEVLDRVKKDYQYKTVKSSKNIDFYEVYDNEYNTLFKSNLTKEEADTLVSEAGEAGYHYISKSVYGNEQIPYTLEEQQEETIVELLGLYTADRLDKVKDGKLISLLKRLLKEMKAYMKSLFKAKEVEIDKLPDNMTLGDIADLLAYSNSKLILPGNEVIYTTPDNQTFKTYQEASNHISELTKLGEVDLGKTSINIKKDINEYPFVVYNTKHNNIIKSFKTYAEAFSYLHTQIPTHLQFEYKVKNLEVTGEISSNPLNEFIEKNKEYEQSKEIIEEWKKVNDIKYDPEEVYSRGQGFYSVVGAYSDFDVELMFQNLLAHIEDNKKSGGEFTISAFTKPVDRKIGHLEGGGGKIKFKIFPKSEDIKWAANDDVYSGSVWDASEKVNKDKKSEIIGVSYTKSPSLNNINSVQPNLADIIDNLAHHHNELGIELTGSNFRLEYDEGVPYSTKKILDNINSILDQKYGKLVEPEIKIKKINEGQQKITKEEYNSIKGTVVYEDESTVVKKHNGDTYTKSPDGYYKLLKDNIGKQPTQTKENLKESIKDVQKKVRGQVYTAKSFEELNELEDAGYEQIGEGIFIKPKEYTTQAEINTRIAALKEGYRKFPRSLIRSEVRQVKFSQGNTIAQMFEADDDLPFQKRQSERASRVPTQQDIVNKLKSWRTNINYTDKGWINKLTNNEIRNIVSEEVESEARKDGYSKNRTTYTVVKQAGIHLWSNQIANFIINDKKTSYKDIQANVIELAKRSPQFREVALEKNITVEELVALDPTLAKDLADGIRLIIKEIKETQKNLNPDGAVEIFSGQQLYNSSIDTVGSTDIMAVYSDGSVGVFEYSAKKFGKDRINKSVKELSQKHRELETFRIVGGYKSILDSEVGNTVFRQARIVPININYGYKTDVGYQGLEIAVNSTPEKYLVQIPLESETTSMTKLDKFVTDLFRLKEGVKSDTKLSYSAREAKMKEIDKSIQTLLVKKDVIGFMNQIHYITKDIENRLNKKLGEEGYLEDNELLNYVSFLEVFLKTNQLEKELNTFSKTQKEDFTTKLRQFSGRVDVLKQDIQNKIFERAINRVGVDELEMGKLPSTFNRLFNGIADIDNPVFQWYNRMLRRTEGNVLRKMDIFNKNINELTEGLRQLAKREGVSVMSLYKRILDDNLNIVSEMDSSYYEAFEDAKKKKDTGWFKKYTIFEKDKYQQAKDRYEKDLRDPIIGIKADYVPEESKEEYNKRREVLIKEDLTKWEKQYNVEKYPNAYKNADYKFISPNRKLNTYKSSKFLEINKTPELKAFYDFHKNFTSKARESVGYDKIKNRNFTSNFRQDVVDRIGQHGVMGIKDIGRILRQNLSAQTTDLDYGELGPDGKPINRIPVYGVSPLHDNLTNKELSHIKQELINEGFEEDTKVFDDEYNRRVKQEEFRKGAELKSIDLATNLMIFAQQVYQAEELNAIEDQVQIAYYTLRENDNIKTTLSDGDTPLKNHLKKNVAKIFGVPTDLISLFEKHVKRDIYGQKIQDEKGKIKYKGITYSIHKLYDILSSYMTLSSMTWDPILAGSNIVNGKINTRLVGKEGIFFTNMGFKDSRKELTNKDKKGVSIVELFKPTSRNFNYEQAIEQSASKLVSTITMRNALKLHEWGDNSVDNQILLSMVRHYKVDSDGKIKNPKTDKLINKDAPSLYDSISIKDDKLEIKNIENLNEEFDSFRAKVQRIAYLIKGSTNRENTSIMDTALIYRILMKFKQWIPGSAMSRFGKLKYDNTLESYNEGRIRAAWGDIIGNGFIPTLKELGKVSGELLSFGMYSKEINQQNLEKSYQRFMLKNPETEFTFDEFKEWYIPMLEGKLRATIQEARTIMILSTAAAMLGFFAGWDDDEETNLFTLYAYRLVKRSALELTFFYDKGSADQLLQNPLVIYRLLEDASNILGNTLDETIDTAFGEERFWYNEDTKKNDQTGFGHYTMKKVPFWSEILDFFDYYEKF